MAKEELQDTVANIIDSGIEQKKSSDKIASAILQVVRRNFENNGLDELWDKHSVSIGTDIHDLQYYAGRVMMTREEFNKMMLFIKAGGV